MEYILDNGLKNFQSFAVFTEDLATPHWWSKFLKKPFLHVLVIHSWEEGGRQFVRIQDPVVNLSKCKVYFRESKPIEVLHWYSFMRDYRSACVGKPPKIIKLKIFLDKYNSLNKLISKLPLCTAYIMRAMGIASYAITPFQLYKALRSKGCRNLF
jgi:hypothetical protein